MDDSVVATDDTISNEDDEVGYDDTIKNYDDVTADDDLNGDDYVSHDDMVLEDDNSYDDTYADDKIGLDDFLNEDDTYFDDESGLDDVIAETDDLFYSDDELFDDSLYVDDTYDDAYNFDDTSLFDDSLYVDDTYDDAYNFDDTSLFPSVVSSNDPSTLPSFSPSNLPSFTPTIYSSLMPTLMPSQRPISNPSRLPSYLPSLDPTDFPTASPSEKHDVNSSVVFLVNGIPQNSIRDEKSIQNLTNALFETLIELYKEVDQSIVLTAITLSAVQRNLKMQTVRLTQDVQTVYLIVTCHARVIQNINFDMVTDTVVTNSEDILFQSVKSVFSDAVGIVIVGLASENPTYQPSSSSAPSILEVTVTVAAPVGAAAVSSYYLLLY